MTKFQPASVPGLSAELWKVADNISNVEIGLTPVERWARVEAWMMSALEQVPVDRRAEAEEYLRDRFKQWLE